MGGGERGGGAREGKREEYGGMEEGRVSEWEGGREGGIKEGTPSAFGAPTLYVPSLVPRLSPLAHIVVYHMTFELHLSNKWSEMSFVIYVYYNVCYGLPCSNYICPLPLEKAVKVYTLSIVTEQNRGRN